MPAFGRAFGTVRGSLPLHARAPAVPVREHMGRPSRAPSPSRPHGAHYRDDGSVWHSGSIARGSLAGESFRPKTTTGYSSIARPRSQYGHRENYPSASGWRRPMKDPPRALKEPKPQAWRPARMVDMFARPVSASSSTELAYSDRGPEEEPWRPKSPDLRRRHPVTGAMVGPRHWGGHQAFREDGTVWHSGSAARPHSQYGVREWYPAHQHAGFVDAVISSSELDGSQVEQHEEEGRDSAELEPRLALDRPMSPEMRAWGAHATAAVAHAQASAQFAQSIAGHATRATWRVSTGGAVAENPVIQPLPEWQGMIRQHGPYPSKLKSELEPEPESTVTVSVSSQRMHRGPRVDHAHPRRVGSPDLLTHKDRTAPGTETIVCYLSAEDVDATGSSRAQLQAACAAQINDHATPSTNLIKFSLADLCDPTRVGPARLKILSRGLSSYSGRLAVVAPRGAAPDTPYDLHGGGGSAGSCSSKVLAEHVCGLLRHLRGHHPAMLRTSQVDLVVSTSPSAASLPPLPPLPLRSLWSSQ